MKDSADFSVEALLKSVCVLSLSSLVFVMPEEISAFWGGGRERGKVNLNAEQNAGRGLEGGYFISSRGERGGLLSSNFKINRFGRMTPAKMKHLQ